jgi:uncharacterized protein YbjT (DUF2867 family)
MPESRRRIAILGATGYVGGRLLRPLVDAGFEVRAIARRPEFLAARAPAGVEVVRGDALDPASLETALGGCDAAFYLVHSMGSAGSFEEDDRRAAENFAAAAAGARLQRIVYLGGLGDDDEKLSAHLASRHETGRILRGGAVPTIELRASVVIG